MPSPKTATRGLPWRILHRALLGASVLFAPGLSTTLRAVPDSPARTVVYGSDYRLPEDPRELIRLDDEMKAYFAPRITRGASLNVQLSELSLALLAEDALGFKYEVDGVYDVREAFRRRRGNCLTFAMLVIAICREFRIQAKFNEVITRPHWDRSGGIILESHHTNVRVNSLGSCYEIDLKLSDNLGVSRITARIVNDERGLAWAYGNDGVYRLAAGDIPGALRMMELATVVDPTYASAWTNLGGALIIAGQPDRAQNCYERALAADPETPAALSGLASLHRKNGRIAEAEKLERQVIRYRERNPYYLSSVAHDELARGNLKAARDHLKRAIRIKANEPEFYELMSTVARKQGLEREAKRWAEKARKVATALAAAS